MDIKKVITQRGYETLASYDLVYEWEDIFCQEFGADLFFDSKARNFNKYVRGTIFTRCLLPSKTSFMFQMTAFRSVSTNKKCIIPNIIDFFLEKKDLPLFYSRYSNAPVVLISSKEVFDYLKAENCPIPINHLALSISDKYSITPTTKYKKEYDLIIMGRQNPILEKYIDRYAAYHPDLLYVYRKFVNGEFLYYTSKGELLGNIDNREDYMNLMRKARIGIYSTPGIDGGEERTKGFNQVTPRFLEYIASGCHILARYPQNSDVDYYKLSSIAPSIDTYEQFEAQMNNAINNEVDMKKYSEYLSHHYTSVRAKELLEIIKDL